MKTWLLFISLFVSVAGVAQKNSLQNKMQRLHQMMVERPGDFVMDNYLHDSLSYGHSNGWIETKEDFKKNMASKYIIYHSFKEDSMRVVKAGNVAYIRFIADIDVTLNGVKGHYHLKVLEVWKKKGKRWILFARQALKG